jgi:hypothetical protein
LTAVHCTTYRFARKDKQTQQHADGADNGRCERSNADEEKGVSGGLDERVGGVDAQTKGSKEGVHGWFALSCLRTDKKTDTTTDTKNDKPDAATAKTKTRQSYKVAMGADKLTPTLAPEAHLRLAARPTPPSSRKNHSPERLAKRVCRKSKSTVGQPHEDPTVN